MFTSAPPKNPARACCLATSGFELPLSTVFQNLSFFLGIAFLFTFFSSDQIDFDSLVSTPITQFIAMEKRLSSEDTKVKPSARDVMKEFRIKQR